MAILKGIRVESIVVFLEAETANCYTRVVGIGSENYTENV